MCAILYLRAQTCALALASISFVLVLTLTSGCGGVSAQQQLKSGFHPPKGSLLTDSLVLTAAHCFFMPGTDQLNDLYFIVLVAGEHNVEKTEGQEQFTHLKRVVIHKDYGYQTFLNDIALVELEKSFTLKKGVVEIIQPATPESKYSQSNCTAAGWGQTVKQTLEEQELGSVAGGWSDTPLFVQLDIIKKEKCKTLYKDVGDLYTRASHPSLICAGKLAGGKDTCVGDSGGPLACQSTSSGSGNSLLVGLVSNGPGCGMENSPTMYTDVAFMEPWLEKARKTLADAPPNTPNGQEEVIRV